MKKSLTWFIVMTLIVMSFGPAALAQEAPAGPVALQQIEMILYGRTQEGALLTRLENAEREVYGQLQGGSAFLVRVQRLANYLAGMEDDVGIRTKLNVAEWLIFNRVNDQSSITTRLERLETAYYGEVWSDVPLAVRMNELNEQLWPGGRMYLDDTLIPAGTLVEVELLTEINSEKSKVNDVVRWRVARDIRVDGKVAIPAGAIGEGRIIKVDTAGRFGANGRVEVDFGTVLAIDSKPVAMQLDTRASDRNRNVELAAGASIAGAAVLGPLGLAAGLFITGRESVIPTGTEFFIEVAEDVTIQALSLVPVR